MSKGRIGESMLDFADQVRLGAFVNKGRRDGKGKHQTMNWGRVCVGAWCEIRIA